MFDFCGTCDQDLREDENLRAGPIPGLGMVQACPECHAKAAGVEYRPTVYPVGSRIPWIGEGLARRMVRVCGVCRTAFRWSQNEHALRLTAEELGPDKEPAVYQVCEGCFRMFEPLILQRRRRDGELPETATALPSNYRV